MKSWGLAMIDKPTRIGNSELYVARVLNMSTAQWAGVQEEYIKELVKARETNKDELEKHGEKAELKLYISLRKTLWHLLARKMEEQKIG